MPDRPEAPAADSAGAGAPKGGERVESAQSPGKLLAAGRISRELTLEEVGDALNLAPQTVEWLEADNFESLPTAAFTQGYIRNYAKHVGLDADAVVQVYQNKAGKPTVAWESPGGPGVSIGELVQKHPGLLITAVVAAVVLLIIIVLAVVWPDDAEPDATEAAEEIEIGAERAPNSLNSQSAITPSDTAGVAAAVTAAPDSSRRASAARPGAADTTSGARENSRSTRSRSTTPRATDSGRFDAPAGEFDRDAIDPNDPLAHLPVAKTYPVDATRAPAQATSGSSAGSEPAPVASVAPSASAAPGANAENYRLNISKRLTPTGDDRLRVEVLEDCWIAIKTPAGKDLYGLLGRPGQTINLTGQGPFRVLLGYAPGAQLYLDDREIGLAPYTRNNVATLVIGQ